MKNYQKYLLKAIGFLVMVVVGLYACAVIVIWDTDYDDGQRENLWIAALIGSTKIMVFTIGIMSIVAGCVGLIFKTLDFADSVSKS